MKFLFAIAFALTMLTHCPVAHAEEPQTLRVMSFNIRYGLARDGDNHWKHRKDLVVETIKAYGPDVLGTQENLGFQAEYLVDKLGYSIFGRSRQVEDSGSGEQCAILFRAERFDQLAGGHLWLSETPDVPGSKSWDSSLPRMATWVRLWDKSNSANIFVINTHFDHRGSNARLESAKLLYEFVKANAKYPIILTGDFNTPIDSSPYKELFPESALIVDTYRAKQVAVSAEKTPSKGEGTFSGFTGRTDSARIDWIGASPQFRILEAAIDRQEFSGRYPSDHYPVTSVLQLQESP